MEKNLLKKFKEAFVSVLPVALIVIVLALTPLVSLSVREICVFAVSAVVLIVGIALFNLGADMAMTPMGEYMGSGLSRRGNVFVLVAACFLMGILITVAEPDLTVLASQVSKVIDSTALIVTVGVGVGLFLVLAVLKIVFRKQLSAMLLFFYMVLFALALLVIINGNADMLALAFDSGGVTTGPITVPFIMALGVGIAAVLGGRSSSENSFGLVALCSVGPILAVMMLSIFAKGELTYQMSDYTLAQDLGAVIFPMAIAVMKEVGIALGLIVVFFLAVNFMLLHLPPRKLMQIFVGLIYTFVGLVIFLTAVNVGFMPIGYRLGCTLAKSSPYILVGFGVVLGAVVVLAEPAVHVLNKQVEDITGGSVSKKSMMAALCIGVGVSIGLSMLRIVLDFNILYYVIPGYLISLGLSFFVPGLYTAIAFDSGGVASGPLSSSFILPFAVGACYMLRGEASILSDAFGIVAMVAMTPLITIQFLGFRAIIREHVRERRAMRRMLSADDEQTIRFM